MSKKTIPTPQVFLDLYNKGIITEFELIYQTLTRFTDMGVIEEALENFPKKALNKTEEFVGYYSPKVGWPLPPLDMNTINHAKEWFTRRKHA